MRRTTVTLAFLGGLASGAHAAQLHVLECEGDYAGKKLTMEQLLRVLKDHQSWLSKEDRNLEDSQRANLCKANLRGAVLTRRDLREANLRQINLESASLNYTDLRGADLGGRAGIHYWRDVEGSNLRGATLIGTKLTGAILSGADLAWAVFEPSPGFGPSPVDVVLAKNLAELTYRDSPHALVELREAFKKAGLKQQERELTYAIRARAAEKAPFIEQAFNYVFFDLTSHYGMSPGRPLKILGLVILICALPYILALRIPSGRAAIWKVWNPDRIESHRPNEPARLNERNVYRLVWFAFYFSILSAFHIGWRDLNVGNWIARIQPGEYGLRATGWVRTISGIESLISVYLVALWVLTYFADPFG